MAGRSHSRIARKAKRRNKRSPLADPLKREQTRAERTTRKAKHDRNR